MEGIGPLRQQETCGARLVAAVARLEITQVETIHIAAIGVAQTEVARAAIDRCNRLGFPGRGAVLLGVDTQTGEILFAALDIDGHLLGRCLVGEEGVFAGDGAVDVLDLLAVNHAVTTRTDVDLLDHALGDVALGIGRLDVVIEQLIAIVAQVGVVEVGDLLGRHHLEGGGAGGLPADAIDIGGEIPLLHVVADPIPDIRRIDVLFPGMGHRIIQLVGLVFRIGALGGMHPDLELDVGHVVDVVGIGVDGELVVHVHLGPAFRLGGVGTARVVRITLRPPNRRTCLVLCQTRGDIGFGEVQRLVERDGRLDAVIDVLVIVTETGVDTGDQEVPAQLGRVGTTGVILAGITLDRIGEHPGIELIAGIGDLLVQRRGR